MILFLYLYTILSLINVSKCDPYEINKIYLISSLPEQDNKNVQLDSINIAVELNDIFRSKCSDFYDIESIYVNSNDRENKTLELVIKRQNVIDLFGPDHSFIDDSRNMIYAGAIIVEDKMQAVFTANFVAKNVTQEEIRNDTQCLWNITTSPLSGAKIMSKEASKINSGDLLDFVMKMEYTSSGVKTRETCLESTLFNINRPIVVVCLDDPQHWTNKYIDTTFNFKFVNNCQQEISKYKNHLTAVLAPKPFKIDTELTIPIIFYDTPYLNTEYTSWFPNSINLVHGILIKYAFIKLIENYGWERVAIISDDSPYSIELENELVQLFNEKRILYNVQRCEERHCNFKKAVENLRQMKAKIVIANVDEENARKIYKYNDNADIYKFNLIFRVPPFMTKWDHYFITLGPVDENQRLCDPSNPICTAIWKSMQKVRYAYMFTDYLRRDSFSQVHNYYRKFAEMLLKQRESNVIAYVRTWDKELLSMNINTNGVFNEETKTSVQAPKIPSDNFEGCFIKSYDFVKYCDVGIILFMMLLVIMFAIMILTISCYFHSTSPINSIKYQQF